MAISTDNSSKQLHLGSRSIGRLLVEYSVPAIIASLATSLYNIVDSIFIGRGVWLSMAFSDILAAIVAIITVVVIIKIDNHKFITKPAAKSKAVETQVSK